MNSAYIPLDCPQNLYWKVTRALWRCATGGPKWKETNADWTSIQAKLSYFLCFPPQPWQQQRVRVQQLTHLQAQHSDGTCTTRAVPLVVMTSVRQQRSVCDLASFFGSRHSSSILATQRRKASSESGLTKQGWRGNGRVHSSGLNTHTHRKRHSEGKFWLSCMWDHILRYYLCHRYSAVSHLTAWRHIVSKLVKTRAATRLCSVFKSEVSTDLSGQ